MSKPRLLVITGSSGVGKSTLSARAAASLGFSKSASTDTIREALRTQVAADELPGWLEGCRRLARNREGTLEGSSSSCKAGQHEGFGPFA